MQRSGRCLTAWTLGVSLAATLLAAPVSAETLSQALSAAYKFNPRLDAARSSQRATDEEVPRALSGYRPSVTGSATTAYQNTRGAAATTSGELNPRTYSVGVVQPLFRGFRTVNAVNGAEATVRAGRETLRTAEASVLLEAVTAFGDVVRDQAIVKLRENNVAVLTRDLKSTQDRFNVGEVTRTDVAQSQARRAAAVSALDLAKANLQTSRATFERVVGHPPTGLVDPRPSNLVPKALKDAIEIALRESPNVVGALYREQAARFAIETIRGELLPTVQVEANYGKSFDTANGFPEIEQTTVTGRLTVPFYTGGEVQARLRQAKQTHVQRLQEIEQARTEQQAQVVQAWSQMTAARAQLESDQASVAASRIALAGVREEERVGQRTLLDVLNAEQELLNNEVNLATDRRNLLVASYSLLQTIGRLNAQELAVADKIYDSEEHYHEVRRKWFDISITHADGRREALPGATRDAPAKPSK
ncbi:MAG: TolC family outer membrane protein [Hyphomicrobiaceae bacterium]|nr:TolC family outer membrane protein [Hyphomicrobiaceae bacterium]